MVENKQKKSDFFLPNFCGLKPIFVLIIGAELLAIVLILATGDDLRESWDELGLLSIFIQWVAIGSASVLCLCRPWLKKLPLNWGAFVAYLIILAVTMLVSLGAELFMTAFQYQWADSPDMARTFVFRTFFVSAIMTLVALRYFYVQQQWKERIELESQARVQALQSKIRPHFLFNSMNIIASLIGSKPALAEQAVEDLSELFRATLKDTGSLVPLSEEWVLCRHYLRIEGLRLGSRLQVNWALNAVPEDAAIPMLSLQPLIENAIYHGIQSLPEGGTIDVEGSMKSHEVEILIKNPMPEPGKKTTKKGHGIALQNIRHRLNLLFGKHASLTTEATEQIYIASIRFPYIKVGELA